jgi:glycogen(starch) synthase
LARLLGLPLIDTFHGETVADDYRIYQQSAFFPLVLRQAVRYASFVTGCSQTILNDAKKYGATAAKMRVVFNGIDWQEFAPTVKKIKQKYIFAIGRLTPVKGFDLLIQAFAQTAKKHPELQLWLGGDGTERDSLVLRTKKLHLEKQVVFLGKLARAQTVIAMKNSLFVVVPSRYEAFGIVAAEALAAGKAVVVTKRGGPLEFIPHNIHGLLVDPLQPKQLAASLEKMLQAYPRLQKGARNYIRRFDWTVIAAQYEELYAQAINRK